MKLEKRLFKFCLTSVLLIAAGCSNPLQNNTNITDKNSPVVTGVTDDEGPLRSKTWTWGCSLAADLCGYRYVVDTHPTHTFTESDAYSRTTTATQSTGTGIYYIHIQVRNPDDPSLTSAVFNYRVVLDNTAPTITSVTASAAGSYSVSSAVQVTVHVSEAVNVVGAPRLALTVGAAPRFANYVSGSGSTTLIFKYTPQAGDTDNDGIAFAASSVDFNGGTIRDQVLWDLAAAFTPPVVSGILVDTTLPVVTGLANDATPTANKTWTWGCSESCTYRYVINTSPSTTPSGNFAATTTASISTGSGVRYIHVQARDAAGNLSAVVHVSAVINGAAAPDPSAWTWAMSSPANGSVSIDSTPQFSVTGASSDNGATVQMYDDSSCTQAVGSVRTIAAGAASFTDVSYLTTGTRDGSHAFYAVATNFGNSSVCTDVSLSYFLDSVNPNAPGSLTNTTVWTTNTTTSPSFTWSTPTDPGGASASGIASIEVGLSTSSGGGNDVVGWTAKSAASVSQSYSGLTLTQCTAYYPSARSVDNAGRSSSVVVATAFRPDSTAPSAPVINVGSNQSLSQTPTITITTPSTDNCSFQGYDFMLSRDVDHDGVLDSAEHGNVIAWTNIGTVTSYQRTSLTLAAGAGYFVSLRSKDAAGNTSAPVSSAVWYGQYCEGSTNGVAYYSYATPALAQLSDAFVKSTVPGWGVYDYSNVGSVTSITAATTAVARPQGDTYALLFSGQLEVRTAGAYTFYSTSDDGSDVYVGTNRVVANDGLHGVTETSGTIALTPGCYDVQVRFFENNGGDEVTLSWQGPSIAKAAVPSALLYPRYVPMPEIDWKFDNGSGTVATDASMNTLNGTLTNGPTWATNPVCAYASARAVTFDGVNDYVMSGTLAGVDIVQTNFSESFWFKTASTSTSMVYSDLSSGTVPGLVIRAGPAPGTIGFDSSGGVGAAVFTATTYNDGGWHQAVAIRRGTNLKLFVDGVQRITTTVASTATTFNKVTVGASGAPANYFSGSIDQFKVWNDALDNGVSSLAVGELFNYPCR